MTVNDETETDRALVQMFDAGKRDHPMPSSDLMARVLADAAAVQAGFAAKPGYETQRRTLWNKVHEMMGGWPGLSALTASVCVGVFFGFSSPDTVLTYVPGIETELADGSFDFFDAVGEDSEVIEG